MTALYTSEMDMGTPQLLYAVGDGERFAALSHSFSSHGTNTTRGRAEEEYDTIPIRRHDIYMPRSLIEMTLEGIPHTICIFPVRAVCRNGDTSVSR